MEVCSRGLELAAADLEAGPDAEQPVREARADAAECGRAQGCPPHSTRRSRPAPRSWFATSRGLSIPYRRITSSPSCPSRADSRAAQHRQHVGEVDPCSFQAHAIADLLGELHGLTKIGEPLVVAAEVGEVGATHGERSDLRLACAPTCRARRAPVRKIGNDSAMAPGHINARERRQDVRPLR